MITIVKNHGVPAYNVNEYIIDNESELEQLHCAIGSTAYIKSLGKSKQMIAEDQWTTVSSSNSSSGGSVEEGEPLTEDEILDLLK